MTLRDLHASRSLLFAGLALGATSGLLLAVYRRNHGTLPAPIPSPGKTLLSSLSAEEQHKLPYPPNVLPGARDVDTPYGSIRVYEWGPENGKRVLFVHGISTPCISQGALAHRLVDKGCRVMLFGRLTCSDLFAANILLR